MQATILQFRPRANAIPTANIFKVAKQIRTTNKYPISDAIIKASRHTEFDYTIYTKLEDRFREQLPHGGIIFNSPVKYDKNTNRLYIQSYGRGCANDCLYCKPRQELIAHGYWNKPFAMPSDINAIYDFIDNNIKQESTNRYTEYIKARKPIYLSHKIGNDGLTWQDGKYKITQAIIKALNEAHYPYVIETKSDLIAHDDYIALIDKSLVTIVIDVISDNEDINRKIEPGCPSYNRRLATYKKLLELGYNVKLRQVIIDGITIPIDTIKDAIHLAINIPMADKINNVLNKEVSYEAI